MKKNSRIFSLLGFVGLALAGCQSAPVANVPVAKPRPVAAEQEKVYSNISVSEAKGVSSPFKTEKGTVFPENKMGYKLIMSHDVSMPNLLATQLANSNILIQIRIYNRADFAQTLDIACARGEDRTTYQAKDVVFPAKLARDIKFTVTEPESQNLSVIVTRSR
jgi:hypothetical protein